MPQSGSEPWFGPELLRTGPKSGSRFSIVPKLNRKSSSRFGRGPNVVNPVRTEPDPEPEGTVLTAATVLQVAFTLVQLRRLIVQHPCALFRPHSNVALESAISDHVTPPELPEPATRSPCPLSSCATPHPRPSRFPRSPPLSSASRSLSSCSQVALLGMHQALSAEDSRIAQSTSRPGVAIAPRCTRLALPPPTAPRSGPIRRIRKDSG